MGGGYSDLNIYFKSVDSEYKDTGYSVTPKQEKFKGCSDFHVINHIIKFNNQVDPLSYNVLLYDGSKETHKGEYLFGYYYPNKNEILESVSIYYSVLSPDIPLVISFNTKGQQKYHCLPAVLKEARWDRAYNISVYTFGQNCSKERLDNEFKKISRNRKICFKIGKESKDVSGARQMINDKFYRYIYSPDGKDSVLVCDHLFTLDTLNQKEMMGTKEMNPYYLKHLDGRLYDGIMIYYEISTAGVYKFGIGEALYMEFIEISKKKFQLRRNDKNGCWWSEETFDYSGDSQLLAHLQEIKSQSNNEVVTIILDKKEKIDSQDKFVIDVKQSTYNKYTHDFEKPNKPIFIFGRQKCDICTRTSEIPLVKKVDVYYLKTNSGDDDEPFVIVIFENGDEPQKIKKAFHFNDEYKFKNWHEVGENGKIEEKIKKLEQYAGCISQLGLLRWYTYKILTGKDPSQDDLREEEEKRRPEVVKPTKPPDGLPMYWIIGGSVGGGVFVISSAALYGVYWYNTTIKLLT